MNWDWDKAEFLALNPEEQKELIAILEMLERDGVIKEQLSRKFLELLKAVSVRSQ